MNCTDRSGGADIWELKGEGANHYLDYDIVHRVSCGSCGWSYQAVKELRDKYDNKNENDNKRKILASYYISINCFTFIKEAHYFIIFLNTLIL
jgi:hypothetical protein